MEGWVWVWLQCGGGGGCWTGCACVTQGWGAGVWCVVNVDVGLGPWYALVPCPPFGIAMFSRMDSHIFKPARRSTPDIGGGCHLELLRPHQECGAVGRVPCLHLSMQL